MRNRHVYFLVVNVLIYWKILQLYLDCLINLKERARGKKRDVTTNKPATANELTESFFFCVVVFFFGELRLVHRYLQFVQPCR